MRRIIILAFALVVGLTSSFAQKKSTKTTTAKPAAKPVVQEKTPEEKLFDEFLPSTAKIMFIDSVVVDKNEFLAQLPLSKELGSLVDENDQVVYTNEFGNTRIIAAGDTLQGRHLYISHRNGKKWDEPSELTELPQAMIDYPFLMTDGVTLYFSAEGSETVGKRDIFRTTYDADDAHFYEAQNMGLPFNSPANEYLLAISDFDHLGWLVTDRNQQEDKVCIYTFEPTSQREAFDEETSNSILKRYASISSIQDTWQFGNRDEAIQRRDALLTRLSSKQAGNRVEFVVNDITTYTSLDQFKSDNGKKKYQELMANKQKLVQLNTILDSTRDSYSTASQSKKHQYGRKIVELEQEIDELEATIASNEKALRNAENK